MSSTPRAKPSVPKEAGASPRVSKPAGEKGTKKKKPKGAAPTAPMTLGMPMSKPDELSEDVAKKELAELQKKYGTLIVTFNNQQSELAAAMDKVDRLESENARLAQQAGGSVDENTNALTKLLEETKAELKAAETREMALQKKVNKLQVEHVSEEEVDQLFYTLEKKEEELEQAEQRNAALEGELLTARQMSARGGGNAEPKYIEIHHHNNISDDESEDGDKEKKAEAPVEAS